MLGKGTMNRKTWLAAAALIALSMGASSAAQAQSTTLYAQIIGAPSVSSEQLIDISGLSFQLPAASATEKSALITLNVPAPYAAGSNYPGIVFGINVNGVVVAQGAFTYSDQSPSSYGRMPVTVVVKVPLQLHPSQVRAQWASVRGSTGVIDSFASLSAILASNP